MKQKYTGVFTPISSACNPSTRGPEAGGLPWVLGYPGLHSEFQAARAKYQGFFSKISEDVVGWRKGGWLECGGVGISLQAEALCSGGAEEKRFRFIPELLFCLPRYFLVP